MGPGRPGLVLADEVLFVPEVLPDLSRRHVGGSWRAGGQKSAVATVKAWQSKHGCPKAPTVDK